MVRAICISEEFHSILKERIVRDRKVRRALEKQTGKKYFETWQEATKELAGPVKGWLR